MQTDDGRDGICMRAVAIAIGGLVLSLGMWGHSQVIHGLGGASLVLMSLFVAPIALALALSEVLFGAGSGRFTISRGGGTFSRMSDRPRPIRRRCHGCGRRRELRSGIWICDRCDFAADIAKYL